MRQAALFPLARSRALDCFVASLLAMTPEVSKRTRPATPSPAAPLLAANGRDAEPVSIRRSGRLRELAAELKRSKGWPTMERARFQGAAGGNDAPCASGSDGRDCVRRMH